MKKAKRIISFLLAVIFVFPIIYQSVHVMQNHWQSHTDSHCCHHDHHSKADGPQYTYPVEKVKPCLVCEFEFASFNNTEKVKLSSAGNVYVNLVAAHPQEAYCNKHIQVTTLRGPPKNSLISYL